jgi:16S rRNA (guanine(966)-N(2))-methyltransferase RsmD
VDIRPTLDRVREAVFSILGERVQGAKFLDLFAGTGANGIEALSRGAVSATFVDYDRHALELIQRNLGVTSLGSSTRVVRLSIPQDLAKCPGGPFDLVYADPPHRFLDWDKVLEALALNQLVTDGSWIIYEHGKRSSAPEPENVAGFERFRTATYGATSLSFYSFTCK